MSKLHNKYHVRTPDEQPLDAGCFVLRPFNADGSVRDPAAVAALKSYANFLPAAERELRCEIMDWIATPGLSDATRHLNVPPAPSPEWVERFKAFSGRLRADMRTGSILDDL